MKRRILFVSDMHFGHGPPEADRASEFNLIDCLQAHESSGTGLVLGGDVFDAWIEYGSLVPKGLPRLLGLLARWTDRGLPVTYVVGNHDPWHQDYFDSELGVQVIRDCYEIEVNGIRLSVTHGDALPSAPLHSRAATFLLRHPVPVFLYRNLLPGDWGMRLARTVKRALDVRPSNPDIVSALRTHARRLLKAGSRDLIVMGHSHVPELHTWPGGLYLNTGAWMRSHHFGRLEGRTIQLCQWKNGEVRVVEQATIAGGQ